jgi:hypothetical protein
VTALAGGVPQEEDRQVAKTRQDFVSFLVRETKNLF